MVYLMKFGGGGEGTVPINQTYTPVIWSAKFFYKQVSVLQTTLTQSGIN